MKNLYVAIFAGLWIAACSSEIGSPSGPDMEQETGHAGMEADAEKGSHGGRLLTDGSFQVELAIFEAGVEPQFRAYVQSQGQPLSPETVQLEVELTRLGGKLDRFRFAPREDYLLGDGVVREPHSFSVKVTALNKGKSHQWTYDSFEGRTVIDADVAKEAGIESETAGPVRIRNILILHGTVVPDPQRVFRANARFPGVVREVRKRIGDKVAAGDVLVVIEANESLQRYNVVAPAAGVVVSRAFNPGQAVQQESMLTVADLSSVWVELAAFQHDLGRVHAGQSVTVRDVDGHQSAQGRIDSIAVVGSSASQSMSARVLLPNEDGRWRPGLLVTGEVVTEETEVPVAVRRSGLQTFRDWTVVFERIDETYEVRPVKLGRSDEQWAEVLEGLAAGALYVSANSYLIMADIEKSGASHDH